MFMFRKPSHAELTEFLWRHRDVPLTYSEVGRSRSDSTPAPVGYSIGRQRVELGRGRDVFNQAKQALRDWKMFPTDFVELIWPTSLEEGRVVATLFRAPGFWTLNPCRIVYTIDETSPTEARDRFGFGYGTIGSHLACGEERFTVEYNHADESVWYAIYCFSRADHKLSTLAYPYLRLQQHRFRTLSCEAMVAAVKTLAPEMAMC